MPPGILRFLEDTQLSSNEMRQRIPLIKEDRIWDLAQQGYGLQSIGRIVNANPPAVGAAVRRCRLRWKYPDDPFKGRRRGYLSDHDIETILKLAKEGVTYLTISKRYGISETAIGLIVRRKTYVTTCEGYNFSFANRLIFR